MGAHPVIVLPEPLRQTVLILLHDTLTSGHLGFQKTLKKIQERFFWPQMYTDIEKYTKKCDSCAKVKTPPTLRRAPHAVFTCATRPMEAIQIDFVGPITPKSNDGSRVILVVTDLFTRYAEAFPLEDQRAPLVARTLVTQFFCRYGAPTKLHSDQGSNFTSTLIKEIMKLYKILHVKGSAYRPQSQGSVERLNRSLIEMLKHYTIQNVFEWSEYVPYVLSAYNSSVNASTLYTPYELFYGRKVQLPLDALIHKPTPSYKDVDNYHQEVAERLHTCHQLARSNAAKARLAQAKYYNYRAKKRDFRVGDRVYITNVAKKAKKKKGTDEKGNVDSRKFRLSWLGPYTIIARKGEVVYEVREDSSGKVITIHEDRLKLTYESKIARKTMAKEVAKNASQPVTGRQLRSGGKGKQRGDQVSKWWGEEEKVTTEDDSSSDEDDFPMEKREDNNDNETDDNVSDIEETSDNDSDLQSVTDSEGILNRTEEEDQGEEEVESSQEELIAEDPEENEEEKELPRVREGGEITEIVTPNNPGRTTDLDRDVQMPDLERYENIMTPPVIKKGEAIPQLPLSPDLPTLPAQAAHKPEGSPKLPTRMRAEAPAFKPDKRWWEKLKPPTPRASSSQTSETSEVTEKRKEDLRKLFDKAWKQKVRHEALYKSEYTIDRGPLGRTKEERNFIDLLLQQATSTYQRGTPKSYPNTRKMQKETALKLGKETVLYAKLCGEEFTRGVIREGRYLPAEGKCIPSNYQQNPKDHRGKITRIQG